MVIDKYDAVFTVEQLMDYLYISRNTAYKLLNSGAIKGFKIGRAHKIPKISIDEYVERMRNHG